MHHTVHAYLNTIMQEIFIELDQATSLAWHHVRRDTAVNDCCADADRNQGGVGDLAYPLVSDLKREIVQKYNVLTPDGVALRGLFIIDKEVLLCSFRPATQCQQGTPAKLTTQSITAAAEWPIETRHGMALHIAILHHLCRNKVFALSTSRAALSIHEGCS